MAKLKYGCSWMDSRLTCNPKHPNISIKNIKVAPHVLRHKGAKNDDSLLRVAPVKQNKFQQHRLV